MVLWIMQLSHATQAMAILCHDMLCHADAPNTSACSYCTVCVLGTQPLYHARSLTTTAKFCAHYARMRCMHEHNMSKSRISLVHTSIAVLRPHL